MRSIKIKDKETIKLFFQVKLADIRYSKQQQWNTIYYTLITIGGIIGLIVSLESKGILSQCFFRYSLMLLCTFISVLGIVYIGIYQWAMARYRVQKDKFREALSEDDFEVEDNECSTKEITKYFFKPDFWYFVIPFWLIILSAGMIGYYVILNLR